MGDTERLSKYPAPHQNPLVDCCLDKDKILCEVKQGQTSEGKTGMVPVVADEHARLYLIQVTLGCVHC